MVDGEVIPLKGFTVCYLTEEVQITYNPEASSYPSQTGAVLCVCVCVCVCFVVLKWMYSAECSTLKLFVFSMESVFVCVSVCGI